MAQGCVREPQPKDDVRELCNVNVGGIDYKISTDAMSSVPGSRLHQIAKNNKYSGVFERPRAAFESILAYHQTGHLHMPGNLCPGAFKQEMKFWGVNPHLMEDCCYHRYVTFLKDQDIMNGFLAKTVEKEEKLYTFLTDKSTRIARLRARMWGVLDNRDDSMIYFSVATAFILIAIFTTALGTLPNTNTTPIINNNTIAEPVSTPYPTDLTTIDGRGDDTDNQGGPPNAMLRRVRRSISENVGLDNSMFNSLIEQKDLSKREDDERLVYHQANLTNTTASDNCGRLLHDALLLWDQLEHSYDDISFTHMLHEVLNTNQYLNADAKEPGTEENSHGGNQNRQRISELHEKEFIREEQRGNNTQRKLDNTRKYKNNTSVQYRGENIEKHQIEIETTHPQGNIEKNEQKVGKYQKGTVQKQQSNNPGNHEYFNIEKPQQGSVQKHQQIRTENYQIKQFRQHQRLQTKQQQGKISRNHRNTQIIQRMNSELHHPDNIDKHNQVKFSRSQDDFENGVGSKLNIKLLSNIVDESINDVKSSDKLIIRNTFHDDLRHTFKTILLSQMQNEPSQGRRYIRVSRSLTSTVENKTMEYENVTENVSMISRTAENITKPVENVTSTTNDTEESIFNLTDIEDSHLIMGPDEEFIIDTTNARENASFRIIEQLKDVIETILPENPTSKVRTMETIEDETQMSYIYIEYATNIFFTCELCFRMLFCPRAMKYFFSFQNVIDMLALAAVYTREIVSHLGPQDGQSYIDILLYMQMFRVLRLLRLLENITAYKVLCYAMRVGKKDVFLIVLYVFFGVLFFSNFIYFFERNEDFPSIPDAWWWSIVTITTVGYGDMAPKTVIGKIIGAVCALSGVFMFSLIIPIFVNTFLSIYQYAEVRNLNDARESKRNIVEQRNKTVKEQRV